MYDEAMMRRAIELSSKALETRGAGPFAAVVVKDGRIIGQGLNEAIAKHDPTSHGEVEAIRDACRTLKAVRLDGCDLYTTCEPCPLCVITMEIVGIRNLYYGASLPQSREVTGKLPLTRHRPTDVAVLRREAGLPPGERRIPATQHLDAQALEVLKAWVAMPG